ncbi:hypothetical protein [Salegentibacter mishustinae]|uniref:hypothetical protein n=1 Tax=Salegentibacter mishustinae TaxID=270918 RepID=UPI0024913525|nr:hypothetical protein [Salegentibacter mishustinae]
MNILIASIYSYNSYSRGIMPDVLQSLIDEYPNAKIYYLTCSNSFSTCYFNEKSKPEYCFRCKTSTKNTLSLVSGEFTHLKLNDIITSSHDKAANNFFAGNQTITKHLYFEIFEIGEASLSTYISKTRDKELLEIENSFVLDIAFNSLKVYLSLKKFIQDKNIDVVYNFNGRQDYLRAVFKAALVNGIDCFNIERARLGGSIEVFKNVLPHNILAKKKHIDDHWNYSALPLKEKIKIGSRFFEDQKAGKSVIFQSYTKEMHKQELPDNIRNGKKNIILYTSSDDEFAAIGKEFENPYFKTQNEGINYVVNILNNYKQEYNLFIRMHPNLKGVNYPYVEELRNMRNLGENIFVIEPDSQVDTYALMTLANKVISFGSTTGLEANFWEKPVILLNKCFYYYSNVCHVPKNKSQIKNLLLEELAPLERIASIKFGFYYLTGGIKTKYYTENDFESGVFFKDTNTYSYSLNQKVKAKWIELFG